MTTTIDTADVDRMTPEHYRSFRAFVERRRWRKATSAAQQKWPHEYTVREWMPDDDDGFVEAVRIIRCYGHPEKFYKHTRIYLTFGNLKYWTMGDEIPQAVVINRAGLDSVFGRQDAPTPPDFPLSVYDWLATEYDARYSAPEYQTENRQIADKIRSLMPASILDIGCGTGLLLEMLPELRPTDYLGVEPSRGMFNEFLRKFGRFPIIGGTIADVHRAQDLAVALFGVASYLTPQEIQRLPAVANRWMLMFYVDGYMPNYASPSDRWHSWRSEGMESAMCLGNSSAEHFGHFIIVQGSSQ